MLRFLLAALSSLLLFFGLISQASATDNSQQVPQYPNDELLNHAISSPEEFLGYPLGEWHLRHDQVNAYLQQLKNQSDKVSIEATGQTYEARQQLTAVISSAKNITNLNNIARNRAKVQSQSNIDGPLVIWLAYSIHGDEASGAHAALATAYYLTASTDPWVESLLEQAVVLITPSQNPDGMDRFAHWANSSRGNVKVSDPQTREHQQDWPGGRTNHYFADLNRDWLFIRHPESQGRVALFQKWQPHYVGDFHEMGSDSSYFFQPGVQSRIHPLTPSANHTLTEKLAKFHQSALDKAGQSYFSNQLFDDFFYGKGSTYPDINGAIGVLFEQASARGQLQDSIQGGISLTQAINNQFATSISSLKGALALKKELIHYQRSFYQQEQKQQERGKQKGVLVRASHDSERMFELANHLTQHQIDFFSLNKPLQLDDQEWLTTESLFIPLQQPQRSLIKALFDERTEFEDNAFYDVSSWSLKYAMNLQLINNVKLNPDDLVKGTGAFWPKKQENHIIKDNAVAVIIDWRQSAASPFLSELLQRNILVKYAQTPFSLSKADGKIDFVAGSLQIPLEQDRLRLTNRSKSHQAILPRSELINIISKLAQQHKVKLFSASTSASSKGIDLGSPDFKPVAKVHPLLIGGIGSTPSEVGEIWRFLDTDLNMPVSIVNSERLKQLSLKPYTHIIFADGVYDHLNEVVARKLGQFVTQGGVIIAQQGALSWLNKRHLLRTDVKQERHFDKLFNGQGLSYGDKRQFEARKQIGGAIVGVTLDPSHPLAFGIEGNQIAVLKDRAIGFTASSTEAFIAAGEYQDDLLKSGYLAKEYQRELGNTPAMILEPKGNGAIVAFSDNLLFRSFWLGTEKIYANALFFTRQAKAF